MSSSPNRHRNLLLLSISAVLLSVLLIAGLFQSQQASSKAEQATVEHGELLLKQTSLLANPLLLSNDRVSLNYLLNELITLPYIRSAQLETHREGVIARAGEPGGIEMQQALSSKQDSHLSIWLDPAPFLVPMQAQLKISAAFAVLALFGSLAAILILGRQQPEYNRRAEDIGDSEEPSFTTSLESAPLPAEGLSDQVEQVLKSSQAQPEEEIQPPKEEATEPQAEDPGQSIQPMMANTEDQPQPAIERDDDTRESVPDIEEPYTNTDTLTEPELAPPSVSPAIPHATADSYSEVDEIPFIGDLSGQPPARVSVEESLQALEHPADPPITLSETEQQSEPVDNTEEPLQPSGNPEDSLFDMTDDTPPAPVKENTHSPSGLPDDIPFIGGARRDAEAAATAGHQPDTDSSRTEPSLETQSLVSLLRPDLNDRSMPQFQPSTPDIERPDSTDIQPDFEESTPESGLHIPHPETEFSQKPNPLIADRGNEEQLSLYTMEHELELALSPEQAGYCLYIDTSAHAGNVEESERQQLLRVYTRLAGQTAALYNGNIAELTNGDMFIRFDRALPDDSHGINALCASALFNLLYRGFNQSRIRAFQPALNLRMSLARGSRSKEQLLLEEARFLTHTTQSNDLISHTALTEASVLKEKLLYQADIRREDEDKVLIISLTDKVQQLLIKQRDQLLAKLK